jgi:hypothetical protein
LGHDQPFHTGEQMAASSHMVSVYVAGLFCLLTFVVTSMICAILYSSYLVHDKEAAEDDQNANRQDDADDANNIRRRKKK